MVCQACKRNCRYLLLSVDPGILWSVCFFLFFFVPHSFFFSSLFQLDFRSWHGFNLYQTPIFFQSLIFFSSLLFPLFCTFFPLLFLSSSNVFPPAFFPFFFLLFSSHSFSFSSSCFLFYFPSLLLFFLYFLKSLLCSRNWFRHVQVRKSLN